MLLGKAADNSPIEKTDAFSLLLFIRETGMGLNHFTADQMKELNAKPYVKNATEKYVT